MPWTYIIEDLNGENFLGTFYEKESDIKKNNEEESNIKSDKVQNRRFVK